MAYLLDAQTINIKVHYVMMFVERVSVVSMCTTVSEALLIIVMSPCRCFFAKP